jgi:hypothetical protein
MNLRPEIIFVKALLPRRSIILSTPMRRGDTMTSTESKSLLLRAAERRERRLIERGPWPRRLIAMGAVIAVTGGAGIALAAWTQTATGAGTAKARTLVAPTVAAGSSTVTSLLYPGLTADGSTVGGDLTLSVTNTNPFPVTITGVAPGTGNTTSDQGAACVDGGANPTGVTIITKNSGLAGTNLTIPANGSNVAVTINKVVSMSAASATGCQGAVFTLAAAGVSLNFSS